MEFLVIMGIVNAIPYLQHYSVISEPTISKKIILYRAFSRRAMVNGYSHMSISVSSVLSVMCFEWSKSS